VSKWLESLRGRLVASMVLVFLLGLAGSIAMEPLLKYQQCALGWLGTVPFEEPYQDFALLVPLSFGGIMLIWLVSGWSLRDLASASREAASVGPANPRGRISTRRLPAEIRPLVDAVNGAMDRLAEAYAAEQHFVADAAHELRTSLAVLSLRLQRAKLTGELDWRAVEADLTQVNRLADQLLDLARKEHARQLDAAASLSVTNLSRVAREAAATIAPLAEQAGRVLDVELPAALPVRGRPDDLYDMVRNLLDNALVHGRGTVRLTGQIQEAAGGGQQAWISVSDEGSGVPAGQEEAVFERFRKAGSESPGHGLGLAIVREVVRGHGGSVELLPGPGGVVRVALPIAAPMS
jgi:signal transduction histidine kinase